MKRLLALFLAIVSVNCSNRIELPTSPSTVIPSGSVTPVINDTIEFRVFGNIGSGTALIKFQDSINGITILPSESLPYIARIRSNQSSIFLFIEADATPFVSVGNPTITQAVLQVQIVINGIVFREGFATGYSALSATASGTWNH